MTITLDHRHDHIDDTEFAYISVSLQKGFEEALLNGPIFRTDAKDLFDLFVEEMSGGDATRRQYHNCMTCKRFIEDYGNLVTVTEEGDLIPIAWSGDRGDLYRKAISKLREVVANAKIVSAFYSHDHQWGKPEAGGWSHFSLKPPADVIRYSDRDLTSEAIAESKERYRRVRASFADIKAPILDEALRVLKAGVLDRSERFIEPLQWLRNLHDLPKTPQGERLFWKSVMTAPEGYTHPRAAVTASLLADIEAGRPFDVVSRRFNTKVDPLYFQRAQTAPSAQAIVQAEKLVADLGIERSLERRFARLEEVPKIWEPQPDPPEDNVGGVFGHLKTKEKTVPSIELPERPITWEKFKNTILPTAKQMQIFIPVVGNFTGVTTAVHVDAPPIFKWDREDNRNPISSYLYHKGSPARQWGLTGGTWKKVTAIIPLGDIAVGMEHSWVFSIEDAKDTAVAQGNGLFMEALRSDLYPIRSVIEAYHKSATLSGRDEASANGLSFSRGTINYHVKVFDGTGWSRYVIDRFD